MSDLILRPCGELFPGKYALQLRHHGPVETDYRTLARVDEETAREIINAGSAFWLFGEPRS